MSRHRRRRCRHRWSRWELSKRVSVYTTTDEFRDCEWCGKIERRSF